MTRPRLSERGFMLTLVLITFLVIEVIAVGVLSVVMSDLHGAVAHQQAMQAINVAEAGLHYGVAQLAARAAASTPDDDAYAGEPRDVVLADTTGAPAGTFHVSVHCAYPRGALPPGCRDDPATAAVDERDLRVVVSSGFVPARPGRARRQIEATVRRYTPAPGDLGVVGICGRERVELGPETTVIADVGSNGDVIIDGPRREPGSVASAYPRAPRVAATVEAVPPGSTRSLSGTYTWRVTFQTWRGEQSTGGPPTPPALMTGQVARLTNIPVGDAAIARRRIYRTAAGAPRGPWFLVGEIPDNSTQEFTDALADDALRHRIPGGAAGSVTAGGAVTCSRSCAAQVDGDVRAHVRDVVCPAYGAPPSRPGTQPAPNPIVQSAVQETVRWGPLYVEENAGFTIETLSVPDAVLHIHLTDLRLERGATLAITGTATVYFHISGTFSLGPDAVFGAVDDSGHLVKPADRVQVYVGAHDRPGATGGVAGVRLERDNRLAALIFAPDAHIRIERAAAIRGALYGRSVSLVRSGDVVLDPVEGLGSERVLVRPSPYQYLIRWYDNPSPGP
jgi:hypothetical protein